MGEEGAGTFWKKLNSKLLVGTESINGDSTRGNFKVLK